MKPHLVPLPRPRYIVMALATGAMALLTAIFLVGAPPIPAVIGVVLAVGWLLWRTPAA
jgi:hypothetical protein